MNDTKRRRTFFFFYTIASFSSRLINFPVKRLKKSFLSVTVCGSNPCVNAPYINHVVLSNYPEWAPAAKISCHNAPASIPQFCGANTPIHFYTFDRRQFGLRYSDFRPRHMSPLLVRRGEFSINLFHYILLLALSGPWYFSGRLKTLICAIFSNRV